MSTATWIAMNFKELERDAGGKPLPAFPGIALALGLHRPGDLDQPGAVVDRRDFQYLYTDGDSFVFMDTSDYDQINVPAATARP